MDAYKVLGISRDATEEQIKSAYRELARKYHPDNYVNNPLSELASEKMKEINEAYDYIMSTRNQNGGTGSYAEIRNLIAKGEIQTAEKMLNEMQERTAEWYFLMGSICYRKGFFDKAKTNFQTACDMDNTNVEYQNALYQMESRNTSYRTYNQRTSNSGMNTCDCCSSLICADCLCECCGGDLISCC